MIVSSQNFETIRVRHSGREDIVGEVIEGSYRIIEEAPKAAAQIADWKAITLCDKERVALAIGALEMRDSALEVQPERILEARRWDDKGNDLYSTFNVIQENLIKGGASGRTATNRRSSLCAVKSVDGDTKLNRALWTLAEKMAEIKTKQKEAA